MNSTFSATDKQCSDLASLLKHISVQDKADLYTSRIHGDTLDSVVPLTWSDLVACPLDRRLYQESDKCFVKIAYKNDVPILIARNRKELADEPYYIGTSTRPLVGCSNRAVGIELGIWFFEHNIIPLLEMHEAKMTASLAGKYQADSFTGDMEAAQRLLPELATHSDIDLLEFVHIVGISDCYDIEFLSQYISIEKIHISAYLPVCGLWAQACPEQLSKTGKVVFHPLDSVIVEGQTNLLLTKLSPLLTPILRYETGIQAKFLDKKCQCSSLQSFSITKI